MRKIIIVVVGIVAVLMVIGALRDPAPKTEDGSVSTLTARPVEVPSKPPIYGFEPEKGFQFREPPRIDPGALLPKFTPRGETPEEKSWNDVIRIPLFGSLVEGVYTLLRVIWWFINNIWWIALLVAILLLIRWLPWPAVFVGWEILQTLTTHKNISEIMREHGALFGADQQKNNKKKDKE